MRSQLVDDRANQVRELSVNVHDSIENARICRGRSGSFPVFRPPDDRRPQEIESQRLEHHGKPHSGHALDTKVLGTGQTIQGREGSLDARTEPVPIAERLRPLPGATPCHFDLLPVIGEPVSIAHRLEMEVTHCFLIKWPGWDFLRGHQGWGPPLVYGDLRSWMCPSL